MTKTYWSDALAATHGAAADLPDGGHGQAGVARVRRAVPHAGAADGGGHPALRTRERISQAVFARYLNVTTGPVSQWERGEKHGRRLAQAAEPGRPARPRGDRVSAHATCAPAPRRRLVSSIGTYPSSPASTRASASRICTASDASPASRASAS